MEHSVIMKALSGFYYVEYKGETIECKAPGRFRRDRITPLVGDEVEFELLGGGKGMIRSLLPRRNSFLRPAVANVDQLIIMACSVNPVTDPFLIDRVAALAEIRNCESVICINKCDLDRGDSLYEIYSKSGFRVIRLSAVTAEGMTELGSVLEGKTSVFTGNSGVGKSSVLNCLEPNLKIATGSVSDKLGRGRHTTRHVEMFKIGTDAIAADTPGFASFDTENTEMGEPEKIQYCFREFKKYLGECRFMDCVHIKEPGCAILEALAEGKIQPSRHKSYVNLYERAKAVPAWERKKQNI